jgi:hypothetical protein
VIRSDSRKGIAAKTLLTREQVRTLTSSPQMPEIGLTPEAARDYIVVDYESYLPVAPAGCAGNRADQGARPYAGPPDGHVRLDSGREYLFIGDVAWTLAGVTESKLKPTATMQRINEYAPAIIHELRWIKDVMDQNKLIVIPSHDDKLLQDLAAKNIVGDNFTLR